VGLVQTSSTPLASTGAAPASSVGPARSDSSHQDRRADPISRSSSSQSSYASVSGEADNVANILGHAARLPSLDPASFPTVYNASAATFPDSQITIAPLLAQLIAMVNDLGASVTFLTSQVESLTSVQAERSATPSPPATSNLEASLKGLSSRVTALSLHRATQVAPPLPQAPPSHAPAVQAKPAQQKKKLATSLTSRTVAAPDFPFLFEGKWYGNPDTYAKGHPDSPQAAILFASRHPQSEEAKLYSEHYPATSLFHTGPPPGFTVSDPPQPQEQTWAHVTTKGDKGKKNATAAQVAASSKSSVPKRPPPLPAAQRHFFAPRTSPTLLNNSFIITATLPDIMAAVLKEANCSIPLSLTASVNRNGAVTLTANPYTLSSAYLPIFDAMTKKLNQGFPVGDNPLQVFREAPTSVELLIHNLPLSILPPESTDLFPSLLESISNAIDVPIFGARFLQSDPVKSAENRTTSAVVAVDPLHVSQFGESIRLFSRAGTVAPAYSASKSTQCRKCGLFGHSAPLCKEEEQACPICTLLHHRSANRCANQSCPIGGFEKSVVGCCNASPPLCINCGGQHASFDGTCPIRREFLSALRPSRDQDIPDAPDVGLPQNTPQGPTVHPTVPATPTRHGPRFPSARESTQLETVKMVCSASAHSSLVAPLPRRNLFGAGSTLFRATTGADWSEPAPTASTWTFNVEKPSPNTQSFTIPIIPLSWLFKSFHCSA